MTPTKRWLVTYYNGDNNQIAIVLCNERDRLIAKLAKEYGLYDPSDIQSIIEWPDTPDSSMWCWTHEDEWHSHQLVTGVSNG